MLAATMRECVVFLLFGAAVIRSAGAQQDSAFQRGGRIVIEPLGVSLAVPARWIDATARNPAQKHSCGSGENAALLLYGPTHSRNEIAGALGEWDREYSAVADSTLPISAVVAHVGAEPWGRSGTCFVDLQARIYVLAHPVDSVLQAVRTNGLRVANHKFPTRVTSTNTLGWSLASLSWDAWYFDYGSTAHMDFYVRGIRGRTVVLLLMYADPLYSKAFDDRDIVVASWRDERPRR